KEMANDALRYGEADSERDGAFALTNLAPGRYWLVTRPVEDAESRPAALDGQARAGLRAEGEASNTVIELKTCDRISNYTLLYKPAVPASKPPAKNPGK